MTSPISRGRADQPRVRLLRREWLSERTLEVACSRPQGFVFLPGQSIRIIEGGIERDYSIASGPGDPFLSLLITRVPGGAMSSWLAEAPLETPLTIEGPRGFFTWKPSSRPAVFAATGTGVAPFLSMARSGVRGFTMIHGVRDPAELLHADELRAAAALFMPCVSRENPGDCFAGRVTRWVRERLDPGVYDFYLCGRRDMIRDMTTLVDERFPGSLLYTEIFY